MKGSVVTRNNHQAIVLELGKDPVTGKRKQRWIAVDGNKTEARAQLKQITYEYERGLWALPTKDTLQSHLEQWLTGYVAANLSPRTEDLYRYIAEKHIMPRLGNLRLNQLTPQAIQALYAEKKKAGLSNRTIQIIHNTLHRSLENAVKTGLLARNPVDAVERPKVKRGEIVTLTETDIHLILEFAKQTSFYELFYTLIFTGMRRGEALGLKWGDIDLLLLKVSINRSMTYLRKAPKGEKMKLRPPKTAKGRRYISVTPSNALVLGEYYEKRNQIRQSLGIPLLNDNDFVFANYKGIPYMPDSITGAWIKLVRKCGLPGRRLHDCRHTYATLLLKKNVHPSIVAAQLGHASVSTTLDIYSHSIPALQELAASKFDDIIIGEKQSVR